MSVKRASGNITRFPETSFVCPSDNQACGLFRIDNKTLPTVALLLPPMTSLAQSLAQRDSRVIWHPYTQHKHQQAPIPIVRGKGTLLSDENDKTYIDAISSWWVTIHGHAHPYIAQKIYEQALLLEQVIFTGFTHEPAVTLAERLLPLLPGDLSRVFYSDNGSTAVEVAL